MTGLLHHERDLQLPARAGDPRLVPPDATEFAREVLPLLIADPGDASVELVYARWKPATSTTACYHVRRGRDSALAVWRRHVDGKWSQRDAAALGKGRIGNQHEVDLSWHVDRDTNRLAFVFPCDPDLPGAARATDVGRLARWFDENGVLGDRRLRRKHFDARLVRYRPGSRAVWRFVVRTMSPSGEKERFDLAVRALAPRRAVDIWRRRAAYEHALAGADLLLPELFAHEERTGLLFERWIDATPREHDDYSRAEAAGSALAQLHRTPVLGERGIERSWGEEGLAEWFAPFEELQGAIAPRIRPSARAWTHGDFHPDCIAVSREGAGRVRLLDGDALAIGDPHEDIATFVAGALDARGGVLADWVDPFLDGYDGATHTVIRTLGSWIALALVRRAAAAIRRLERNALEHAATLLTYARDVEKELGS